MWIDLFEWSKTLKIFKSHVNAYQTLTLAEGDFDNQVGWMIYSVGTSQPLTPATPTIFQWAY